MSFQNATFRIVGIVAKVDKFSQNTNETMKKNEKNKIAPNFRKNRTKIVSLQIEFFIRLSKFSKLGKSVK